MSQDHILDEVELEKKAIELANQGSFAEARKIFFEVLQMKDNPVNRAQVMGNIMLTFEKEGDKDSAIEVGRELLEIPELHSCDEGKILYHQVYGFMQKLECVPFLERHRGSISMLTGFFSGSAIGAALEGTEGASYGTSLLVAFVGMFLFFKTINNAPVSPYIILIGGGFNMLFAGFLLFQLNTAAAIIELSFVIGLPTIIVGFFWVINR